MRSGFPTNKGWENPPTPKTWGEASVSSCAVWCLHRYCEAPHARKGSNEFRFRKAGSDCWLLFCGPESFPPRATNHSLSRSGSRSESSWGTGRKVCSHVVGRRLTNSRRSLSFVPPAAFTRPPARLRIAPSLHDDRNHLAAVKSTQRTTTPAAGTAMCRLDYCCKERVLKRQKKTLFFRLPLLRKATLGPAHLRSNAGPCWSIPTAYVVLLPSSIPFLQISLPSRVSSCLVECPSACVKFAEETF